MCGPGLARNTGRQPWPPRTPRCGRDKCRELLKLRYLKSASDIRPTRTPEQLERGGCLRCSMHGASQRSSDGGQIRIQDDHASQSPPSWSKFCSDPHCCGANANDACFGKRRRASLDPHLALPAGMLPAPLAQPVSGWPQIPPRAIKSCLALRPSRYQALSLRRSKLSHQARLSILW